MKEKINNIDLNEIRTINKLLIYLGTNKRTIRGLKDKKPKLYEEIKKICDLIIANIYDLAIDRPRQSQQYITLAKAQTEIYEKIFIDENEEAFIAPEIKIIKEKSETNL